MLICRIRTVMLSVLTAITCRGEWYTGLHQMAATGPLPCVEAPFLQEYIVDLSGRLLLCHQLLRLLCAPSRCAARLQSIISGL